MGLAAAWRRQGAWATAVTFLVPGALTLAVATALLGSGFRGLGALSQVISGPQVPEARLAAASLPSRHHAARLPTVPVLRPLAGVFGRRSAGGAGPAGPQNPAPASPVATVPLRRIVAAPIVVGGRPAPPRTPPASRPVSPERQVGEQVAGGVGKLPVVGPAGHDAMTTVLDAVAPPPPPVVPVVPQHTG